MRTILVSYAAGALLALLMLTGHAKADCTDGTIFVPNGNFYCSWYGGVFFCDPEGTCEPNCGADNPCVQDRGARKAKETEVVNGPRIPVPVVLK